MTLLLSSSNSMKKSQPALPISTIEERLEQYTQAIEVRTGPSASAGPPPFMHPFLQPTSVSPSNQLLSFHLHSSIQPTPLYPTNPLHPTRVPPLILHAPTSNN